MAWKRIGRWWSGRGTNAPPCGPAVRAVIRPEVLRGSDATLHLPEPWQPGQPLVSSVCRHQQCQLPGFRQWAGALGCPWQPARKLWEYCFICAALEERGMLTPGHRGLGFAVGQEPLSAAFAARGCAITATDLPQGDERVALWSSSDQWARGIEALNVHGLCEQGQFARLVSFRPVDMNHIPADLTGYDFTWSSCAFEHCGTIALGLQFLTAQMDCLRPGGIAVHTTELNLSSNGETVTSGPTVIFRVTDLEQIIKLLQRDGHSVAPLDLDLGSDPMDHDVARPPDFSQPHLRLELGPYVSTSVALIIRKRGV